MIGNIEQRRLRRVSKDGWGQAVTKPQVLDDGHNKRWGRARLVTLLLLALAVSATVVVGLRVGTDGHDSDVPQEVDDAGVRPTVPSTQGPVTPPSESTTTVPAPPLTRYSGNGVQVTTISTPNTTLLPVVVLDSPTGNGVVLGRLVISDSESDQISYSVTSAPSGGAVEMHADGSFTYTPSSATRHAAAARNDSTRDTFIIMIDDGHGRNSNVPVSVPILPLNAAPTATTAVGAPNVNTGMVAGSVSGTDPDGDPLTYSVATTAARGSVIVNADGSFTYTPTNAARQAAAAPGGVTTDSFTISVDDGYGGSTSVPVSVPIAP